jgi:HSP20 family molecular chaperone IbpA
MRHFIGLLAAAAAALAPGSSARAEEAAADYLTPQQRAELRETARRTAREMKRLMSDFRTFYGELKTAAEEEGLIDAAQESGLGEEAESAFDPGFGQADIFDGRDVMIVTVDVPGVRKEDLSLRLRDRAVLEVEARRSSKLDQAADRAGVQVTRRERLRGDFRRSLELPHRAAEGGYEARLEEGVLTVRIPKEKAASPDQVRKIPVS